MANKVHALSLAERICIVIAVVCLLFATLQVLSSGAFLDAVIDALDPQSDIQWSWEEFASMLIPENRLPSVPLSLRDNIYLDYRAAGYCDTFTGNVLLTVLFVNDPDASWTDQQLDTLKSDIDKIIAQITDEASGYGVQLQIQTDYKIASAGISLGSSSKEWATAALESVSLSRIEDVNLVLAQEKNVDAAPVVFLTNQGGRSSAYMSGSPRGSEYAILYEDCDSLYHELSHIFGAKDFYFPAEVKQYAQEHLPDSVMCSPGTGSMDSMTAYLVGWTDELSEEALGFLEFTDSITDQYLKEQSDRNVFTGDVTDYPLTGGSYTGQLYKGMPHGYGKFVWENGHVYEGDWVYSKRTGKGRQETPEHTYTGEFIDGIIHGTGTIIWASGDRYEGQWEQGKYHGTGTLTSADGGSYTGQFSNGLRHGEGTNNWANGTTYTGSWVEGKRSGQGRIEYENGNTYEGSWLDDKFSGYGTYYWPTGGRHEGYWLDGKRHGTGTYTSASGRIVTGTWENDERIE